MEAPESNNNHVSSFLQREKWCAHEFLYKFRGFWFPLAYLETTKRVVQDFKPLPSDVILASFPKTGTTWLKALLHSIIHPSPNHHNPLMFNHPQELIPSLETNLYLKERGGSGGGENPEFQTVEDTKEGRILATHIPYQILGDILNSCDCKIVYVTRNPKDVLVSLWHFVQKSQVIDQDPWDLEVAVDQFCRGVLPFGSYYDHVLAYREESLRRPEKVFFATYEELKENPKTHVKKLAEFLGSPLQGEKGDEKAEEIVKICSFETLSSQEVNKSSELPNGFPLPYSSFFRKGDVGDHVNCLKDDMIQKIDAITRENFHASGFEYGI